MAMLLLIVTSIHSSIVLVHRTNVRAQMRRNHERLGYGPGSAGRELVPSPRTS